MPSFISHFTQLIAGFSVFSAAILLFAYLFFLPDMRKSYTAKFSCALLLIELSGLQLAHYYHFLSGANLLAEISYLYLLLLVPPTFHFFSSMVLFPDTRIGLNHLLHLAPVLLAPLVPLAIVPVVAFLIGTGYTFWFARVVYRFRDQHSRFKVEMFFFALFALIALMALLLGLSIPYIDHSIFYAAYAISIGIAMILVSAALIVFPELLADIVEIAEIGYANSTLGGLDVDAVREQLDQLMRVDKVHQNENLSLVTLADMLGISSHQLSELINSEFNVGFPKFIREWRVASAKKMLLDEPEASVLSISMATGFKSQSNFYSAFKEITGESPGGFRKSLT